MKTLTDANTAFVNSRKNQRFHLATYILDDDWLVLAIYIIYSAPHSIVLNQGSGLDKGVSRQHYHMSRGGGISVGC